MTTAQMPQTTPRAARTLSRRAILLLWLLGGVLLLLLVGSSAVSRTQEARVLETARQMLGGDAATWLTPQLNGHARIAKPPLCYWMTAAAYEITGRVSEAVGRIPTVIVGWLTLGITFIFAAELFDDDRTALASSAAMLGSLMFFKHMRLAETDAPAALFVTLTIFAFWRAAQKTTGGFGWLQLAGASIGLAAMAKGGPAAYPVIFLLGYSIIEERWDLLKRFFTSGAILTAIVLGSWWYLFIIRTQGTAVFRNEAGDLGGGHDHPAWPIVYIPWLLRTAAPWSGVLVLAIFDAIRQWKRDPHRRMLLIWSASILLPLCVIGNKQDHYLVPIVPPMMILIGYSLLNWPGRFSGWLDVVVKVTYGILIVAALAIPLVGMKLRGRVSGIDELVSVILLAVLLLPMALLRAKPMRVTATLLIACPFVMLLTLGVWAPSLPQITSRTIASQIRDRFGDGPYVFYGPNLSLPLCFELRSTIPSARSTQRLLQLVGPETITIAQTKNGAAPPPIPQQFVHELTVRGPEDQTFELYTYKPADADSPASAPTTQP